MITPDIKLKKNNLEVEYYDNIPIEDFIKEISPNVADEQVYIDFDEKYKEIENNDINLEDNTISFIKRKIINDDFITYFISFIENPDEYRGIAYKKYDPKYKELASILYIYKTDNDYYIEYQYPMQFNEKILIADGFIDTSIHNYNIEIKDTKDKIDDNSFLYGLALTEMGNQIRYDYSGGKLKADLDFTLLCYTEKLTEENIDIFTVGELGDRCLTYVITTDEVNYVYIKNLETNIEYIYEEIELEKYKNTETLKKYIFLSRCEDGVLYDEHNNIITTKKNNLYDLYVKKYTDKIEEFEKNYIKPCGMLKGFPDIDNKIFNLDNNISTNINDLLFNKDEHITPGNIVRKLERKI